MRIIDIHTHGIGGYDTRTTRIDHILKIAKIQGSHGVSEILLTIYPTSIEIMRENLETVRKAMEKQRNNPIYPVTSRLQSLPRKNSPFPPLEKGGKGEFDKKERGRVNKPAKIIGMHLEGPFLNPSKCGALDRRSLILPTEQNFEKLIEGFKDVVKIITVAPEMKGALRLIRKIAGRGIIVSMGHSDATYAEAEAGFHAGARGITHVFNAMRGFHHREPGIAEFGLLNPDIFIEVIADPYHLHPKTLELIFKVKDPRKIIIVSDTVKKTKTSGRSKKGIFDTSGRLLGGSMTITESARRLIELGHAKNVILKCITENPRMYLNGG